MGGGKPGGKWGQVPGSGGTWQAMVGGGTPFTLGQPGEAATGSRSLRAAYLVYDMSAYLA